jgi:hypothetical protein
VEHGLVEVAEDYLKLKFGELTSVEGTILDLVGSVSMQIS